MATVQLKAEIKYSKRINQLLKMLNDSTVRRNVNQKIADAITPYVPMQSGKLRRSVYVGPQIISWGRGLPYARYQFNGEKYEPSIPITRNGEVIGYFSRSDVPKRPTGEMMGVTTPGTMHHWTDAYQGQLKAEINRQITNYLKRECKARGLNT